MTTKPFIAGIYAALCVACCAACASSPASRTGLERRLYVANKSSLTLRDIDAGHEKLRRIELPEAGGFKGIAVSVPLGLLYVTSHLKDEVIAVDLATERIAWRRSYAAYADSLALTPDGRTLYVPFRHAGQWWAIDAASGEPLARIETGRGAPYASDPIKDFGPHNTVASRDGRFMYLAAMTIPYVFVVDTATHAIVSKIGPFSRGVRPFSLSEDGALLFANVDGLLGFEVADARSGAVLHRVEAKPPRERVAQVRERVGHHHTPSHGIAVRPGSHEVWVSDDVYGYLYVYDFSSLPPQKVASVALFDEPTDQRHPGWISFSIDGRFAYASCNRVVDASARRVVERVDTSERVIEVQLQAGRVTRAGVR